MLQCLSQPVSILISMNWHLKIVVLWVSAQWVRAGRKIYMEVLFPHLFARYVLLYIWFYFMVYILPPFLYNFPVGEEPEQAVEFTWRFCFPICLSE